MTAPVAAARLGLTPRTLQRWEQWRCSGRRRGRGRGRPARCSDRATRQRLLGLLALLGPHVGVPTLQAQLPDMPRREVQDLVRRYRRVWRRRHRQFLRVLHWQRPGTVWAIDFAEPPAPVEGCYPHLLAVRDLASGQQLAWLPVADETAETVAAALQALFREHGAPLVLKSDNGSAFIAEELTAVLAAWGVWQLRSPPEWPQYNGACEAGIGSMKTRTHHQAAAAGRPGEWACDDAEAARRQANETARPWGAGGPTPEDAWGQRRPITPEERAAFAATVRQAQQQARGGTAAIDRAAISQALEKYGLLTFDRRARLGVVRVRGRRVCRE